MGWCMIALPCLLFTGLVFLIGNARRTVGFLLVESSVLLYLAFIFLEDALAPGPMARGDWVFTGIYVIFCAIAAAAGWLLKRAIAPGTNAEEAFYNR